MCWQHLSPIDYKPLYYATSSFMHTAGASDTDKAADKKYTE